MQIKLPKVCTRGNEISEHWCRIITFWQWVTGQ